ncbi:cytochrome c maturation protein CcmE, partial [Candidatus Falkowbacteria bacterium]|nr:cytochrome c maturation protein CcmE [Candidatus Falkowbacteria bacterium]
MTLDNNFDSGLLNKIKEDKLKPKPLWHFLLKNYVVWLLGIFSLLFGSISVSLFLYLSRPSDFGLYNRAGGEFWQGIMLAIPFFWLICSAVFIFGVIYNIKHTKRGYQYSPLVLLSAIIVLSVLLGTAINFVGAGKAIDGQLGRHAPFYNDFMNPRINFWSNPSEGRLAGLVVERQSTSTFRIVDKENKEWTVVLDSSLPGDLGESIPVNAPSHFLGKVVGGDVFEAKEVLPPMPGDDFFHRFKGGHGSNGRNRGMGPGMEIP